MSGGEWYTFEGLCNVISNFAPCMDDYPYVMDLEKDEYFISEKVLQRFAMPVNHFSSAIEMHKLFVHPDDIALLTKDLQLVKSGAKDEHNIKYRWIGKNGETIWINCRGRVIIVGEERRYMIGCVNEIGKRQAADNISGLLESSEIRDVLEGYYDHWENGYILRLGIDDFKEINERFGIEYGDYVLGGVADCIVSSLFPGQKAYRVPSDEFIVMDFVYGTEEDAVELYKRICSSLERFIEENHYKAIYTISGGIVSQNALEEPSYSEFMKISQFALQEAKERGKNQVYRFKKEDYEVFTRKKILMDNLRKAVTHQCRGFELFFQPIVNAVTGQIYAAEALLRFKAPDGELISPMEFIPLLESSCLIIPVGKWVLERAIEMCHSVQKIIPEFHVSINLSYVQILKSPIMDEIFQQVERAGLSPQSLIVEMTESGYLEHTPSVKQVWENLKEFGVCIAIDDFGTGYSNLQSIGNLAPNVVKLDRGFTRKALNNDYENRVMRHIIEMVHSINLKICVEGIETEEELSQIRELEPDYIQGYYFGKPCNRQEFEQKFLHLE